MCPAQPFALLCIVSRARASAEWLADEGRDKCSPNSVQLAEPARSLLSAAASLTHQEPGGAGRGGRFPGPHPTPPALPLGTPCSFPPTRRTLYRGKSLS